MLTFQVLEATKSCRLIFLGLQVQEAVIRYGGDILARFQGQEGPRPLLTKQSHSHKLPCMVNPLFRLFQASQPSAFAQESRSGDVQYDVQHGRICQTTFELSQTCLTTYQGSCKWLVPKNIEVKVAGCLQLCTATSWQYNGILCLK